ncbi:hypothetical protein TI05_11400 [Achromatium sp. WMS3]|nr:hypothetical protein TI05_11400 [Achromatium sp. WMS3]
MHKLLQRLILDHQRLAVLLNILERQLNAFHVGNEHDLDLVCELVDYIKAYEDQVHHPTEDLIFAHFKELTQTFTLIETSNIPETLKTIQNLQEQHQILAGMTKRFHNILDAVMQGDVIPRQEVENQGRSLIQILRNHINLEEQEVFADIDTKFSSEDWEKLEPNIPEFANPIFEKPDTARFSALLRHLVQTQ